MQVQQLMPHGLDWDQFGGSLVEHVRGHPVDQGTVASWRIGATNGQEPIRSAEDLVVRYAYHFPAMDVYKHIRELHHGREGVVFFPVLGPLRVP